MSKRIRFFLSHLGFSILISFLILFWVFFVWYPAPLAKAVGVTHIFLMLISIDMIIGPLLGLIVYKEGKKTLRSDLAVVILIQISALCYGVYSIGQGRPSWIVYNIDRFDLVRNNEIIQDNILKTKVDYKKASLFKPEYVAIQQSQDIKQRTDDMFTETMGGVSLAQFPERYQPLNSVTDKIQNKSQGFDVLNQFNQKQQVENIVKKYPTATAWLPLKANAIDMVVLINKEKGEVVKIVDLRPWK